MKVVVCPDSYKGTMTAIEAAEAISTGVKKRWPVAEVILLPVGDGGEGTICAIRSSLPDIEEISVETYDPLRRPITASYIISEGKTAFIESAAASGITLIISQERDIYRSDTYGTGLLIADAFNRGVRDFTICMGGTATCDAGYSAYEAIKGLPLESCSITLLCDVDNPLCGPQGTASTFAPQKGAKPEDIPVLDSILRERAAEYKRLRGVDVSDERYSGAAGGLAGMVMACYGAIPVRGIEKVLELIRFEEKIKGADLIITGEGRADRTTLRGKAPKGILDAAQKEGVPVILIGGKVADADVLVETGFRKVLQATPEIIDPAVSPAEYLTRCVVNI